MYGKVDSGVKEKILSYIGTDFAIEFEAKSIYLVVAASSIHLTDWHTVKEFPLAGVNKESMRS
jgi:hypothetical protein